MKVFVHLWGLAVAMLIACYAEISPLRPLIVAVGYVVTYAAIEHSQFWRRVRYRGRVAPPLPVMRTLPRRPR